MRLPDTLNRKAVRLNFDRLEEATWNYLFDYEKDNGLYACRTSGWGKKAVWYSTSAVRKWLVDNGYYGPADFDSQGCPIRDRIRVRVPRGARVVTHFSS